MKFDNLKYLKIGNWIGCKFFPSWLKSLRTSSLKHEINISIIIFSANSDMLPVVNTLLEMHCLTYSLRYSKGTNLHFKNLYKGIYFTVNTWKCACIFQVIFLMVSSIYSCPFSIRNQLQWYCNHNIYEKWQVNYRFTVLWDATL